jgi:L-iditol 2-dehydrogenase
VHKALHKTVTPPIVLGHEVTGDVLKTGKAVKKFQEGDRVVVPHHTPCLACFYCHHDHPTLCDQYTKTNIDPGGFSEYIRVPQPNVERAMLDIGDCDYEEAAFVEPVACCLHAWERISILPTDTVLIVGAGPIGLLHLELAQMFHAGDVYVADVKPSRLQHAKKKGGIPVNPQDEHVKAEIVIIAAGNKNAYEFGLRSVNKGGQVSFFAECPQGSEIRIDPNMVYGQELTFTGSYSSTPFGHWQALSLIQHGVIHVNQLITHRFPLEGLREAIELAAQADTCLKIMIHP